MALENYRHWLTAMESELKRPAYLLIADLIEQDLDKGALQSNDRLPPIRALADFLSLNYTTVTRAYKEAVNRGLIESVPGKGSHVKGRSASMPLRNGSDIEMSMNMPPDLADTDLEAQISRDMTLVVNHHDLRTMLRYQDFGGSARDRAAAGQLLAPLLPDLVPDRLLISPGIHGILTALLSMLCQGGKVLGVEPQVYPGLKAIAAQLGVQLLSVKSDSDGPIIPALEELCRSEKISALYLNPTNRNPNTESISLHRRMAVADVALRYNLKIIEDDAYGLLVSDAPPPIATFAPELTYYVSGLSKCFSAGCRIGYLYSPSIAQSQLAAGALRALSVMASPITVSMQTQWIESGTLPKAIASIRSQCLQRQLLAEKYLHRFKYKVHPEGFHLWLSLPKPFEGRSSDVALYLRANGVSAVGSAAFCTDNAPEDAIRICLGGSSITELNRQLLLLRETLDNNTHLSALLC